LTIRRGPDDRGCTPKTNGVSSLNGPTQAGVQVGVARADDRPTYMNAALLILRAVMGLGFAAHGTRKLFRWFGGEGIEGTGVFFDAIGFRPGNRFARIAGLAEIAGGLLVALGFLNPVGPALVVAVMLVAILTVHRGNGFFAQNCGSELPVLYITGAVTVAVAGPGLYSLDHISALESLIPATVIWVVAVFAILGALGALARRRPVPMHADALFGDVSPAEDLSSETV
jgi:putative oxidoreductase